MPKKARILFVFSLIPSELNPMNILSEIEQARAEIQSIRRAIHAHPELRYEEHRTAELVAHTRARLDCAQIWTRCPYRNRTPSRIVHRTPEKCMRAGMTAIPRCCSARPAILRGGVILTAPSI